MARSRPRPSTAGTRTSPAVLAGRPSAPRPPCAWALSGVYTPPPYLGFLYPNTAYHFYSPEPGPPTLLWYRVEYANGETQLFRIPDRSHDRNPLHYQRLL